MQLPIDLQTFPALSYLLLTTLTFLQWCIKVTDGLSTSNNGTYPSYQIIHMNNDISHMQTNFFPLDAKEVNPYAQMEGETLNVTWLNSTTSTISVHWGLSKKINITGYVRDSKVEYFPADGRFTSHPLNTNIREFTFKNLNTGTLYTICVHMNEVYGVSNSSLFSHSKCVKISTIDHMRKDSVVFLVISLGYYGFMALLGYSQWKKKQIMFNARNRKRGSEDDLTPTMRWKDLAEREKLVNNPNCSIEYRITS